MIYMTKKIKTIFSSFIIFFTLFVSSCSIFPNNVSNKTSDDYATVYINIIQPERAAVPVLPEEIIYSLEAVGTGSTNSIKSNDDSQADDDFKPTEYMLKLKPGTWTVTVTGKDSVYQQSILSGTKDNITVESGREYHENIFVFFIKDKNKNGSCSLQIETTGTNITSLKISETNTRMDGTYNVIDSNGKKIITIDASLIPATNYSPILTFYNNNTIVTVISGETINIRQNMTTDTWYKTNNSLYLKYQDSNITNEASAKADFILTQKIIDSIENDHFYVSETGNDSNDGSIWLPYKTLSAAINRVNELNNVNYDSNQTDSQMPRKSFFIYCDGTITQSSSINLNPEHELNLTITSKSSSSPASINFNTNKINYTVNSPNTISIQNIILKGEIYLSGTTTGERLFFDNVTGTTNLTNESYCKIIANNSTFNNITLGQNPDDSSIITPVEKATLSLTNCNVTGTLNCYGTSSVGAQNTKCTITAENTNFQNACICSGDFTATNCDFNNTLSFSKNADFTFTGNENKNNIKNLITISDDSTVTIQNAKIGEGITSGNDSLRLLGTSTSTLTLKDVEITKNINASSEQFEGSIFFEGSSHFTGEITSSDSYKIQLGKNANFYVNNTTPTTETDKTKYAAIELSVPAPKLTVITPKTGSTFSKEQFDRFELHNPGYYLDYDSVNKKGIVKLSSVKIIVLDNNGCTLEINGITKNNGKYILSISNSAKEITVSAKDKEENDLIIKEIIQKIGDYEVIKSDNNTPEKINFDCSIPETYSLIIRYVYNQAVLDANITIIVQ